MTSCGTSRGRILAHSVVLGLVDKCNGGQKKACRLPNGAKCPGRYVFIFSPRFRACYSRVTRGLITGGVSGGVVNCFSSGRLPFKPGGLRNCLALRGPSSPKEICTRS